MRPEIDAESPPNGPDKGKGKGKAPALHVPSETTPLLPSGSSTFISSTPDQTRNRLVSKLLRVFFISLCVCVAFLIFLVLIVWSYAARVSHISPDHVLNSAMQFEGPDRINVLNVTESGGIWVTIDGRVGLDAGRALGLNTNDGDSLFSEIWKSFGRWGIRRVDRLAVDLDHVELVSDEGCLLATLDLPPVEMVLTVDPPYDSSWLQHVSTTVYLQPTQNTSDIVSYFGEAWRQGKAIINVHVGSVSVQGGRIGSHSWRDRIQEEFNDIKTYFVLKIPQLPGLPQPGRNIPFPPLSDLITLETFSLSTVGDQLSVSGRASIVDPAPLTINITVPSLPFVISLQPGVHIAAVNTASFTTTHPNITLLITGSVLPVPSDSTGILSTFLSRYLSALPNPIILSTPLIPKLDVDAEFPAPHPRPRVLRNVTIHDMKLKAGNTFLASGTVFARVVLPQGMDIDVDVTHVLPDVLVFDGEVPDYIAGPGTPPDTPPFPDPLPERAFAHIRPDDWLDSDCMPIPLEPGEEGGSAFEITAKIDDVPLEVLPGRQNEFSNFVRKVVFGTDGAVAGLLGTVAVSVDVPGMPVGNGEALRLDGLPFKGSVKIGKKNMLRIGF